MNKKQKRIVRELKEISKKLGHSPKRREVPKLAAKCYMYIGSFNKAKEKAGLSIKNVKIVNFPKRAFKIDKDLVRIASYLTFDGHLFKDLKGMMYSSKNIEDLKEFEKIIKRKFRLPPRYHLFSSGGGKTKTHKIYFFNKRICEWLFKVGIPKGDKVIQKFDIPKWIISSKEFSREYLKIAFFCEGCFKEEKGRTPRIQINLAKCEDILDSGLKYMDNLRSMLKRFNIDTKKCHIYGRRIRKTDGKVSRDMRFRIEIKDNNRFIREIGWFK